MKPIDSALVAHAGIDTALATLHGQRERWAAATVRERLALLARIRDATGTVAERWVEAACLRKGLDPQGPLAGEEWLGGPYALLMWVNAMSDTLERLHRKRYADDLALRDLPSGQLAARVMPGSWYDRILLSGIRAEVWMQPGVTRDNFADHLAGAYDPRAQPQGKVALVLGAGNVASIAPLDVLHKLYAEHQVVVLKMNPVNDYLLEFLEVALAPLVDAGYLCIVRGGAAVGAALASHPLVEAIHITGSQTVHDRIVWGDGAEAERRKAAGTPLNAREISSELGGVSPTIVVPGDWSEADIAFQAEHVATQKLQNAGFNCVASQVLVLAADWPLKDRFVAAVRAAIEASTPRPLYYPGAQSRLDAFQQALAPAERRAPADTREALLVPFDASRPDDPRTRSAEQTEVFAPALAITELPGGADAADFLQRAIAYADGRLAGTLGANLLIDPATRRRIGRERFDRLLAGLHYGTIAVNGWTAIGFLLPHATWGAFPGHTLADVQSGIGVVHNARLFDRPERTVVEAPFRPFPRGLLHGSFSLLPRPPWFIGHRRAQRVARLLTRFEHRRSPFKLPAIIWHALRG